MGASAIEGLPVVRRRRGVWRAALGTLEGRVGICLGLALIALVVVGPLIAPYSPDALAAGPSLSGPSSAHLLGTDQLGRDVLSRVLSGGRTVLLAPLAATVLAFIMGGLSGMWAAYRGGVLDRGVSRVFDLFLAIPSLLIVLVVITRVGTSWPAIVIVVAVVFAPRAGRVVRGATQAVVSNDYVTAARLRGDPVSYVVLRELLPNAAPTIIANFCLYLTYSIIFVSTLSFLGLGAQPPSADWGLMVSTSRQFISANPWATLVPALGIASIAIAFTLMGDALTRQVSRRIRADGGEL
jgi:peptide/nickel transport system permease protein